MSMQKQMYGKMLTAVCILAVTLLTVSAAHADFVATTNETSLASLESTGDSLFVLDKEFFNFDATQIGYGGGAVPPDPNGVLITGGFNDQNNDDTWQFGEDVELRINAALSVGTNQVQNITLRYGVRIQDQEFPNARLHDVKLEATGMSALGAGSVNISEMVYDAPPSGSNPLIGDPLAIGADPSGTILSDANDFTEITEIHIVKDISLSGGTESSGDGPNTAHVSEVFQSFSQIPEPATLALLGLGGLFMVPRRRRR